MENQDAGSGTNSGGTNTRGAAARILFVGDDAETASDVPGDWGDAVIATDVAETRDTLQAESFDCLVVEGEGMQGRWENLDGVVDCPVVLYTGTDSGNIDRDLLAAAQTVVDRRVEGSEQILARKIERLTEQDGIGQPQHAGEGTRDHDSAGTSGCFVVATDGTVHTASVAPGALFGDERDWTDDRNFYRQVSTLTATTSAASPNLLSLVQAGESRDWDVIETVGGDGRQYRHASYPATEGEGLRFEVFQPVVNGAGGHETTREGELADYRSLVESAGDPMYVVDSVGTVQMVNETMADFVGESRDALVGASVTDMLPSYAVEEGRIALDIAREREQRNYESFETWLTDADGRERLVEATVGPTTDPEHDGPGAVVTLRDVTERHNREQELDLIKQIFSRSLRHNIRNKASVIESFATLLADDLTGEHAEMAEAILRASNSLAQTSEKVSDFDWIVDENFDIVEHDLAELLRESVSAVADTTRPATIEFDVDEGVNVEGIRDLQYAFENLVENALEHGTSGGAPTVTIETEVGDEEVSVVVADEGPGIPEGEIRVLEEGQETELEHGSGLGLWLVDQVVDQSGGDLSFHVDDGTEARVTLQRADVEG